MLKMTLRNTLVLLIISSVLSACGSVPIRQDSEMSTLYQSRWVNTSTPHTAQDINSVASYLSDFDVVFFGELHEHPGVHLAQMQLFQAMQRINPQLSLSLEQFDRDKQGYLDDYLAGKIGEKYLISKSRAWENYPTSYRPLVEFARLNNIPVIAANAPKQSVVCVGRKGLEYLDTLSTEQRAYIAADIDTSDSAYRQKFMSYMTNNAAHGGSEDGNISEQMKQMAQRSFSAQAVRDDTMAESIARHLADNPQRQLLHLNGIFHSSKHLGTVERLQKRMPELKIAVIETVTVAAGDDSWINEKLDNGNLLLLVKQLPVGFIDADNEREWSRAVLKKRMGNSAKCVVEEQSAAEI